MFITITSNDQCHSLYLMSSKQKCSHGSCSCRASIPTAKKQRHVSTGASCIWTFKLVLGLSPIATHSHSQKSAVSHVQIACCPCYKICNFEALTEQVTSAVHKHHSKKKANILSQLNTVYRATHIELCGMQSSAGLLVTLN